MIDLNQSHHSGPGRPREFDADKAILDAMNVFWDCGYHGTALPDLIEGTGLSRGSLYKAFGDKKGLFLAALDRYTSEGLKAIAGTLSKPGSAKAVIRESLLRYARLSSGKQGRRGCLVMATATEMTSHDAEIAERVKRMFRRMQDLHAGAIIRGQAAGEIPADRDERALARFLLCQIQGMRALGKAGASEAEMEALVDIAMRVLD
jgi:TetR/AcrR family transcriptional regulator, transcriptional repressor for nem operon